MGRNKIFILLRFVKINSKIVFIDNHELENIATNKNIIIMFQKRLITKHAQCSPLKFFKSVGVGVEGSTPYRNAGVQVIV